MKFSRVLLISITVLFSQINFANATGDAGCGLGSLIFTSNHKLTQLLAYTTNMSFGTQTFGITTGTSNCSSSGIAKVEKQDIFYAESNFDHLTVEMAKGEGENLSAFAQILGCSDQYVGEFGKMTKQNYEKIFPSHKTTAVEMLQSVKGQMQAHPVLSKECKRIG
jgi:hypothetical protein